MLRATRPPWRAAQTRWRRPARRRHPGCSSPRTDPWWTRRAGESPPTRAAPDPQRATRRRVRAGRGGWCRHPWLRGWPARQGSSWPQTVQVARRSAATGRRARAAPPGATQPRSHRRKAHGQAPTPGAGPGHGRRGWRGSARPRWSSAGRPQPLRSHAATIAPATPTPTPLPPRRPTPQSPRPGHRPPRRRPRSPRRRTRAAPVGNSPPRTARTATVPAAASVTAPPGPDRPRLRATAPAEP